MSDGVITPFRGANAAPPEPAEVTPETPREAYPPLDMNRRVGGFRWLNRGEPVRNLRPPLADRYPGDDDGPMAA